MSQLQVTGEAKIRDIQGPVVANSGVITALDGAASQYVRGDGTLADFPTSTGGGSSVSYYLNSSVSQGTIGGVAYRELSKEPIIGAGTDITISANGYVASYITDANDPDVLSVPGGNFNCEFYFSVNNNTGNPTTYAELYKYDGTTFTLLGSSVAVPESLNQGTTIAPYYFAIPVATAALALTDRLAIRIYVSVDGRTVTLHTENSHLCQVVTTFSKGMVSLNNLTDQSQFITTGTSGTDFNIVSTGDTHTFNLPVASATNTGKLSSTDWSTFNNKVPYTGAISDVDLGAFDLIADNGIFNNVVTINATSNQARALYMVTGTAGSQYGSGTGVNLFSEATDNLSILFTTATTTKKAILNGANLTTAKTFTLPNASGTIALTSNLSSYVPYTGATGAVNLGFNLLTTNSINLDGNSVSGVLNIKSNSSITTSGAGYVSLVSGNVNQLSFVFNGGNSATFTSVSLSASRTYSLPDAGGTIALLSGTQTFTGATTFSSDITVNGVRVGKGAGSISGNTALGVSSLNANTTGNQNTAIGYGTLPVNLTGNQNTAVGYAALSNNTASSNTAIGFSALVSNTTGSFNTGIGVDSLVNNTTGSTNTAIGNGALQLNTTGLSNTAIGHAALNYNTTSSWNTAVGVSALGLSTGGQNTAIGYNSLGNNTTGVFNIAIGYTTGSSIVTGNYNTIIGNYAGTAAMSNNIVLADGQGNIRYQWNGTNNVFTGAATFSSSVTANSFISSSTGNANVFNSASATTGWVQIAMNNTSGSAILAIESSVAGTTTNGSLAYATILRNYTATDLQFATNNIVRTTITSAGNVGIGTSSPSRLLSLGAAFGATAGLSANVKLAAFDNGVSGDIYGLGISSGMLEIQSAENIGFYNGTGTTRTERMRITSSGNVGIGTSSPTSFSGYTTLTIDNTSGSFTEYRQGGVNTFRVGSNESNGGFLYTQGSTPIRFGTIDTERMRITSGGAVQVGIAAAATNVEFNINGVVNKAGRIQFQESGVNRWLIGNGAASENGRFEIFDATNGTGVQLLRGATSWTALSDERFKDIIEPIIVLDKLKDVRAVIGKYKTDNENIKRNFLIAQDLLKVFPEVVDVDVDESKPMGVRYTDLIPVLVKAIQEQTQIIKDLEARIKQLENK